MSETDNPEKYRHLKRAVILSDLGAVAIFLVDSFMIGAPMLAMFVLFYLVFYLIPACQKAMGNKPRLKYYGFKAIIFSVVAAASFGFHAYDISLAEARAQLIITAVDKYHQDKGAYPAALQDLVPAYLPVIPKPRIGPDTFYFLGAPENPHLMHVNFPPFGRTSWSFKDKRWISID